MRIGRNITFLMVAVLLFAAPVLAQLLPVTVNVNVPFEFTVGNKNYPAGQYQIRRIATYAFVLRDRNQHALTTFPAVPVEENTARVTPVLRFQGENGRQVLTEVWPANGRYGFQFFPPKPTVALARVQDNSMKAQVETEVKASAPAR